MPTPGQANIKYGGDTCCLEVRTSGGALLILDAGMGLHWLGRALMAEAFGAGQGQAQVLLSHTHWGHIQGIPFFIPLLIAGNRFSLYGPGKDESLREAMEEQLQTTYCPVPDFFADGVGASIQTQGVEEGSLVIGDAQVQVRQVNHAPGASCFAYRIEAGGHTLAYIPDVEYLTPSQRQPALELAQEAALLFHDAHYRVAEYRPGCGHASDGDAVALAREAGVRRLVLFHHHPDRSDQEIDAVVAGHQGAGLAVEGARQGQVFNLEEEG